MTTATLDARLPDLDLDAGLSIFVDFARQLDLPHTIGDQQISLQMPSGKILVTPYSGGVGISLHAENDARLYALQQVVHARLDRLTPVPQLIWDRVNEGALPPNLSLVQVQSVTQISANFRRVRVTGPDIGRFTKGGLHFRLVIPQPGRAPLWPRISADGRTIWPEGDDTLHRPVYTVRDIDPAGNWLDFDVFLHHGGRVTNWTATATAGQPAALMGPSGGDAPEAGWVALFADETALPAMARILASLPDTTKGHAFAMVPDLGDRQALICPPQVTLRWLTRGSAVSLLSKLETLEIPATDRFVWFSSEKSEADTARAYLREGKGLTKADSNISAYWNAAK